jgi:hypothetical protein
VRARRLFWIVISLVVAGRVVLVTYSAVDLNRGDFYATLPGAYAETLNPSLWNSPDLMDADGYGRAEYLYGPTQYLTIAPVLVFDSYQSLATALLIVYFGVICAVAEVSWRSFRLLGDAPPYGRAAVWASTWMFLPVLQAYGQREFEIIILLAVACAVFALFTRREAIAGALLGYVAWFKFFPLIFFPYLVGRRLRSAVCGFAIASLVILGAAHSFLDLSRFAPVVRLASSQMQTVAANDFCEVWSRPETRHHALANQTRAGIKWALCSFQDRWGWLPARWVHAAGVVGLVVIAMVCFVRLERLTVVAQSDERWRRLLEVSLLLIAPWLAYAHYYYLAMAIIPLNGLLVRYLAQWNGGKSARLLWVWGAAYMFLGAFVLPVSTWSQLLGTDYWRMYMRYNIYFFGQMLLLALVLWEYVRLSRERSSLPAGAVENRSGHRWPSRASWLQPQTRTSTAAR